MATQAEFTRKVQNDLFASAFANKNQMSREQFLTSAFGYAAQTNAVDAGDIITIADTVYGKGGSSSSTRIRTDFGEFDIEAPKSIGDVLQLQESLSLLQGGGGNNELLGLSKDKQFDVLQERKEQERQRDNFVGDLEIKIEGIKQLKNEPGLSNAVGPNRFARTITPFSGNKDEFLAKANKLIAKETLDALIGAKNDGATFGALSNQELNVLKASAQEVGGLAIYDNETGVLKGFRGDENNFLQALDSFVESTERYIQKTKSLAGENTGENTAGNTINKSQEEVALEAALQEAISNPNDPRAQNIFNIAEQRGYDITTGQKKSDLGDKADTEDATFGEQISGAASNLVTSFTEAEELKDEQSQNGVVDSALGFLAGSAKQAGALGSFLGETAFATLETLDDTVNEGRIGKALSNVRDDFFETEGGQYVAERIQEVTESVQQFEENNPKTGALLEGVVGLTELAGLYSGTTIAKKSFGNFVADNTDTAKAAANRAKNIVDTKFSGNVDQLLEKAREKGVPLSLGSRTPEDAIANIRENLKDQIYDKTSTKKNLDKAETDILTTISERPDRYLPEIDLENRTLVIDSAVKNANEDISRYANALNVVFDSVDKVDGGVNTSNIIDSLKKSLNSDDFKIERATIPIKDRERFVKDVEERLEAIRNEFGDKVPREAIWELRKNVDGSVAGISDTNNQKTLREKFRQTLQGELEVSVPDNSRNKNVVRGAMIEMQKLIEARDYMQTNLNARKIAGGRLTDIIATTTSAQVGGLAGGATGFISGPVGAVVGAVTGATIAKKIGKVLAKNILTSPLDRRALKKFIAEDDDAMKDLLEYGEDLKGVDKENFVENIKNLTE